MLPAPGALGTCMRHTQIAGDAVLEEGLLCRGGVTAAAQRQGAAQAAARACRQTNALLAQNICPERLQLSDLCSSRRGRP